MSVNLMLLLACPLLLTTLGKIIWPSKISWKEYCLALPCSIVPVMLVYWLGSYSQYRDTELLNGEVTGKARETVSCSHSYSCNCRMEPTVTTDSNCRMEPTVTTDSKGNASVSYHQVCDTCYEHDHDYDWDVDTSLNHTIRIDRIDRQGIQEPPRWTRVYTGEPVALEHEYDNYVKAAADSLFHEAELTANKWPVPAYPIMVYDYYNVDRVISSGVKVSGAELQKWSRELSEDLKLLGPTRQANAVVLLTNVDNPNYVYAVKKSWQGAKKNDIVILIGAPNYPAISWVQVFSWSKNSMFDVSLRDDLSNLKTFDFEKVRACLKYDALKYFKRRSMKEFAYLKSEIDPPMWVLILAWSLSLGLPIGAVWYCYRKDIFDTESVKWPR